MQKQVVAVVLSTLVLVALGVGGCATEAREEALGKLGQESARIIGGDDDATHDAVVLLRASFQGGVKECSGTIVKVDAAAQVGYVLTAAHCVSWKPTTVLLGANPDDATTRQYRVLDMTSAAYSGTPGDTLHDVAVVRFLGASASTPVIPIAGASDGVDVGSAVTSVGYGITTLTPPDSGPSESPRRRHVARTLSAASTIDVKYTQADGHGVCSGDSGGPVLFGAPGAEKVVAVHSAVEPDCAGTATSVRVSGELAYVEGALGAALPSMSTCAVCAGIAESGDNACAKRRDACTASAECRAVLDCRGQCTSQACADACMEKPGAGLLLAFQACSCQDACKSECASSAGCNALPKCGAQPKAKDACDACGVASCCAERRAASFDATGYACVSNPKAPGCADASASPATRGYETCLAKSCADACGIAPASESADADAPGPTSGDAGATTASAPTSDGGGCAIGARTTGARSASTWLTIGVGLALTLRRRRLASSRQR